jgi:hypothetical protein
VSGERAVLTWFVSAHVIDVLTGERLYHRAIETGADGTVTQIAATAPAGRPDAETGIGDLGKDGGHDLGR